LHLERQILIFLVEFKILFGDEGDLFVGRFGTENIAKRNILEALSLSDIVIVWLSQG
jgi:hypothetical protein